MSYTEVFLNISIRSLDRHPNAPPFPTMTQESLAAAQRRHTQYTCIMYNVLRYDPPETLSRPTMFRTGARAVRPRDVIFEQYQDTARNERDGAWLTSCGTDARFDERYTYCSLVCLTWMLLPVWYRIQPRISLPFTHPGNLHVQFQKPNRAPPTTKQTASHRVHPTGGTTSAFYPVPHLLFTRRTKHWQIEGQQTPTTTPPSPPAIASARPHVTK